MAAEEDEKQNENESLRSLNSRVQSPIQFFNRTGRRVKVIWMNYRGEQVEQKPTLHVHENRKVDTFVTHPWIAVDEDTSERLLLNFRDIYYPEVPIIRRVLDIRERRVYAVRKEVVITVPVYKLEDYCKKEIRKLVPNEGIRTLPLPKVIIEKLLEPTR